jgi:hypothetical protein
MCNSKSQRDYFSRVKVRVSMDCDYKQTKQPLCNPYIQNQTISYISRLLKSLNIYEIDFTELQE